MKVIDSESLPDAYIEPHKRLSIKKSKCPTGPDQENNRFLNFFFTSGLCQEKTAKNAIISTGKAYISLLGILCPISLKYDDRPIIPLLGALKRRFSIGRLDQSPGYISIERFAD